jgi:hypothetical protein
MQGRKPISATELTLSTEAARRLLESLKLESYVFSVEPAEDDWELRIECAIDGGWQALSFPIEPSELIQSLSTPETSERIQARWDLLLANCRREQPRPAAGAPSAGYPADALE